MAGKGTRLRPHTITTPKPLIELAGKTMLEHALDRVSNTHYKEVILIVDEPKEELCDELQKKYKVPFKYEVQTQKKGAGQAIYLAKPHLKQDSCLILFADTLLEANIEDLSKGNPDGIIWTKEVEDPRKYGVVFERDNKITKLVEKPEEPESNKAIVGMYYFKNSDEIFDKIEYLLDNNITSKNEFQITDAIQLMVDEGKHMTTRTVTVWKDCGNLESLLEANQYLLKKGQTKSTPKTSVIIQPVHISEQVHIQNCIIGPNVSIGKDTEITGSIIQNTIIGRETKITRSPIKDSIIGDNVSIIQKEKEYNMGDYTQIKD